MENEDSEHEHKPLTTATIESASRSTSMNYSTSGANNISLVIMQATAQSHSNYRPHSYPIDNFSESAPKTEKLDGSFLTLGIGSTADAMSRCNISGVESIPVPAPQSNTSNSLAESNLNPSPSMADSVSDAQSGVYGPTFLGNGQRVVPGVNARFLSNPRFTAETPQNDQLHATYPVNQLETCETWLARSILRDIRGNNQWAVVSGVSSSNPHYITETPQNNRVHEFDPGHRRENSRMGGIDTNSGYQGHSAIPSIPRSTQLGLSSNDQRTVSGVDSRRCHFNPRYVSEIPQGDLGSTREDARMGDIDHSSGYQGSIPTSTQLGFSNSGQRSFSRFHSNPQSDPGPTTEDLRLGGTHYQGHSAITSIPRSTQLGISGNAQRIDPGVGSGFRSNTQYVLETPQNYENARLGGPNVNYGHQGHSTISSMNRNSHVGMTDSRQGRETSFQPAMGQSQNFMETVGPQRTGILIGQSTSNTPVTNNNGISQPCSVSSSTRPSLKRDVIQSSQATFQSQHDKMRKRSPNSSGVGYHMAQANHERSYNNTPLPNLLQTTPSFSPHPQMHNVQTYGPYRPQHFSQQSLAATQFLSAPHPAPQYLQQPQAIRQLLLQPQPATHFLSQLQIARPQMVLHPLTASQILSQPQPAPPQTLHPSLLRRNKNTRGCPTKQSSLKTSCKPQEHIKWQDPNQTKKIIGHKCFICQRDLSLSADGSAFRSNLLPPSAILPCGHTFHDHCLELNTPPDQATNPPCILCTIMKES
ncbi:uncharacterized protein LOC115707970 [Cannabis sativa]|uniref:uncharacterized protein LOC115707970 n=1 Tax=Cannabis sativa TaxID=3483 RepID=UPI0029CA1BB6|nr:uncharacterized protein LOC115707970 [Cannabis sativa]XP_030491949.2 uncharacterized protein LOC115707970 [Cannabis sativa]XP_030491951.2 uncharacterized protein LOC115707970 [Cannabis sativa]XP_060974505.1 uncharacterized protein LOC115707970 [Cannabis sativa]